MVEELEARVESGEYGKKDDKKSEPSKAAQKVTQGAQQQRSKSQERGKKPTASTGKPAEPRSKSVPRSK